MPALYFQIPDRPNFEAMTLLKMNIGRGYRVHLIDSFAFHLTAARVFLPMGFPLACIDAGFVFSWILDPVFRDEFCMCRKNCEG